MVVVMVAVVVVVMCVGSAGVRVLIPKLRAGYRRGRDGVAGVYGV